MMHVIRVRSLANAQRAASWGSGIGSEKGDWHPFRTRTNLGSATATEWTAPGAACGNCHAIDALQQRVVGNVSTIDDAGVTNVLSGELQYRDPVTAALADSTYASNATVAEVYCTTCHNSSEVTDPHRTGRPWTPGSFPLVVPIGASDQAFLEKSPSADSITGTPAGALGTANTCIWCHKSREDVTSYVGAANVISSPYWGPHEGPEADIFSAKGGYEFAGMAYGTSTHQQKLTCIDCHMPNVDANSGIGDHSFAARLDACKQCHAGATGFDMNGGQSLIRAALFGLEAALNAAGYLTRSSSEPYLPLQPSDLADGNFRSDEPRPSGGADSGANVLTAIQAGALYNYLVVARGGALGVHNPTYVRQLIYDSSVAITGQPPTFFPRPQ